MGIRIQPREINVPADDPFKNDLLDRRESVEVLTHLVHSFEGPCVLAVDAAWGNGKTTFLRIWAQYLRNERFPVVEFNAWETDFFEDPFVALSTELTEGLQEYTKKAKPLEPKIAETKKVAKKVFRRAVPGLIRIGAASIPVAGKEVGQLLASWVEGTMSEYQEAKKSVKEFRDVLQDMAGALSKSRENRPLIVMIDELDRCRPSYAVELLEAAKHLFAVDHIVFVLAVNRSELANSIKGLYGNDFDAQGYLRRFFDVDFRLPEPDRKAFINELLATIGIDAYFERTKDQDAGQYAEVVPDLLLHFFSVPKLSLRRIAQAIHRLGLVFASLRSDQRSFAISAVVALVFRTIKPDLYHRFVRGEASDLEVVDAIFDRTGTEDLQERIGKVLFEAVVIVAAQEDEIGRLMPSEPINSPLLERYQDMVNGEEPRGASDDPERRYANRIIDQVKNLRRYFFDGKGGIGFKHTVQRIELLSAHLIEKPETEKENS